MSTHEKPLAGRRDRDFRPTQGTDEEAEQGSRRSAVWPRTPGSRSTLAGPKERHGRAPLLAVEARGGGRVLAVVDRDDVGRTLAGALRDAGHHLEICVDAQAAIARMRSRPWPVLIALDSRVPRTSLLEIRRAQEHNLMSTGVPVILLCDPDHGPHSVGLEPDAIELLPLDAVRLQKTVERVLLQAALRGAEARAQGCMDVLNITAAGLRHEINNPLSLTLAYLVVLRRMLSSEARPEQAPGAVDQIERASRRIAKAVHGLCLFTRTDEESAVRVQDVLDATLALVSARICTRAMVRKHFSEVAPVRASAAKLGLLFLSLLNWLLQSIEGSRWSSPPVVTLTVTDALPGRVRVSIGHSDGQREGPAAWPGATSACERDQDLERAIVAQLARDAGAEIEAHGRSAERCDILLPSAARPCADGGVAGELRG